MPNTAGRLRFVGFGNEVIDFDIITERLEAVGEPLRDVELMPFTLESSNSWQLR